MRLHGIAKILPETLFNNEVILKPNNRLGEHFF